MRVMTRLAGVGLRGANKRLGPSPAIEADGPSDGSSEVGPSELELITVGVRVFKAGMEMR